MKALEQPKKLAGKLNKPIDPQTRGEEIIEAASTVSTKTEQAKISPAERETLANLASDFPEFVVLDEKNPGHFYIRLGSLQYYPDPQSLGSIRGPVGGSEYSISGNMAKYAGHKQFFGSDEHLFPIKGDMSIFVLSGALQICKEFIEAESAGKGYDPKKGKEFADWIKKPTETFEQRRRRQKKEKY